jgi:hypothetical protein
MLKAHQEDQNTFETQSSQPAQRSTNNFGSKTFSQIGFVLDLAQKLVGLWTFLAKNTNVNCDTCIIKKKDEIQKETPLIMS